jgi:hypothetical protein
VDLIAEAVVHLRQTPEEFQLAHPHLTLAQIHSALAYYFDHREEIEASLQQGRKIEEDVRQQFPARLPEKARMSGQAKP